MRLPTHTCLGEFLDCGLDEIEWEPPKLPYYAMRKLRVRVNRLGKIIAADWLAEAKAQLERTADQIRRDAIDQLRRDELAAQSADLADSARIAEQMAIAEIKKPRRAMNKAIKRERQKLERAGRALARAKLAAFRNRTNP
jgi:hypothetical protein